MERLTFVDAIKPFRNLNDIFEFHQVLSRTGKRNLHIIKTALLATKVGEMQWTEQQILLAIERLDILWPRIGILSQSIEETVERVEYNLDRAASVPQVTVPIKRFCPSCHTDAVVLWTETLVTLYSTEGPKRANVEVAKCKRCDIKIYGNMLLGKEREYSTELTLSADVVFITSETAFERKLLLSLDADL